MARISGPLPPFSFKRASVSLVNLSLRILGFLANQPSYSLSPGPFRPSFLSSKKFSMFQKQNRKPSEGELIASLAAGASWLQPDRPAIKTKAGSSKRRKRSGDKDLRMMNPFI